MIIAAAAALAASAALFAPSTAEAVVIGNGTVQLGVGTQGQLNDSGVGIRSVATGNDGTIAGCPCEGWGAAVAGTGITTFANNSTGISATPVSFASTATTATAVVSSTGGELGVTHAYAPSTSPFLYQADVTITNLTGGDFAGATLYRRVMDWDIPPTTFTEFSTIQGTAGATNVAFANDNGFCSSDPLAGCPQIIATGDFVDSGPTDHGAAFQFTFAPLLAGASRNLTIFYGVAPSESLALAALGSVGAEIYSFGQASNFGAAGTASRETFIFGFKGVGGVALPPPDTNPNPIPEPATWAMLLAGFLGIGAVLRSNRRRALAVAW